MIQFCPERFESDLFRLLGPDGPDEIQNLLNPHRNSPYPLCKQDHLSRFPAEFRWIGKKGGWIDASQLKAAVAEHFPVMKSRRNLAFIFIVNPVLDRVARARYADEWKSVAELGFLDRIIGEQPAAQSANASTGRIAAAHLQKAIETNGTAILMDLGCGELGTTVPILNNLPADDRHKFTFILVDVMEAALQRSSKRLIEDCNVNPQNIITVRMFLQDINQMLVLEQFAGRVDASVSGACIHQNPNFWPIFQAVYRFLAPGGMFRYWDWLHPLWKGPVVSAGWNLRKSEIQAAREMARIWVGLHGYGLTVQEKQQGLKLSSFQQKLEADFDDDVQRAGFSFEKWVDTNLAGIKPPNGKCPYRWAEGHRPPEIPEHYLREIFGAGNVAHDRFPGTEILHGFVAMKPA